MPEQNLNEKQIREKASVAYGTIRKLADRINAESRDFNTEEKAEWEAANAEYNSLEAQLASLKQREDIKKRADAIGSALNAPADRDRLIGRTQWPSPSGSVAGPEHYATAFAGWMRYQGGFDPTPQEEEAAQHCGVRFRQSHFDLRRETGMKQNRFWGVNGVPQYGASMSSNDPTKGGYTIPQTMMQSMEIAMLAFGGIRQVADVMTTDSGEPMSWPTANDTSNTGRLIGEGATQTTTTTTNPSFGVRIWNAYQYTSDFILIPYTLLQDSAFNLPQVVGAMLGERVGRITNTHFTTGDGAAKPYGIVTESTLGTTTASGTAIAADELYDLVHSVDPSYRGMGCGFMFHDGIFLALRKLKDGNGRYLWQEGLSSGEPNRLIDYPYTINQQMQATVATGTKTMLFGLLSKYKIRDVSTVRLRRLEERFAENDMVGFAYLTRHDGKLLDAGTHPVKHLLQA